MKNFSIKDLAKIIRAHTIRNTQYAIRDFTDVSTDSRTTRPGDCFFAIAGDNFNGADFIADAFAKGAVCAVVEDSKGEKFTGDCILKVHDTIKALGDFARKYRQQASFKVVAITGSVGKTTTRQIAYHVLSQHYRAFAAPKNFNNNIGLPLTLLGADPEDRIVIVELGSNHPGEIAYLTRIAQPDIAVVTNIYPAHLAGFGDLQTIIQEKLSISEALQPDGILIVNADIVPRANLGARGTGHGTRFITFGKSDGSDCHVRNITYNNFGSSFTIDGTAVSLPLPGLGNVENALAAWAICRHFGLTINDFALALKTLPAISMRAELLQIGTLTVLNDCYNANPASMKNALDILANLRQEHNRRLVFICGDMAELGRQSEQLHAELGVSIAKAKVKLLLAVGKFAKIVAEAAKRTAEYDLQIECFENTISACNNLQDFIKDYDIILVKGSRVAKLEIVVEKLNSMFDTRYSADRRPVEILDKNKGRGTSIENRGAR